MGKRISIAWVTLWARLSADLDGHSDPVIHRSIVDALSKGLTLPGPTELEARLAHAVCERFTSI
jgi:glutamate-1-semialdehyde aminotransferase